MTSTIKKLKLLLLVVLVIFSFLSVIILLINSDVFDEELSPEVSQLLKPTQFIPNVNNGYIYFSGLLTSEENDPAEIGAEYVDLIIRYKEDNTIRLDEFEDKHFPKDINSIFGALPFVNLIFKCDKGIEVLCIEQYVSQYTNIGQYKANIDMLLKRYQKLVSYDAYQEKPDFDVATPMPSYRPVLLLSKIALARSYKESPSAFIQTLKDDVRFWKMVARDANTLIAKLIAYAILENQTHLASLYIKDNSLTEHELTEFDAILSSFTPDEIDISEAFLSEARMAISFIAELKQQPISRLEDLKNLVIQPNATINLSFLQITEPLLEISKLSTSEFYKEESKCMHDSSCLLKSFMTTKLGVDIVYNPFGKWMLSIALPDYTTYIDRVHKSATYMNLVRLQLEIAASPNTAPEIIVAQSSIKNPMTGKPMDIDLSTRTISYQCGDKEAKCAVSY